MRTVAPYVIVVLLMLAIVLAGLGVANRQHQARQAAAKPALPTMYMVGDNTVPSFKDCDEAERHLRDTYVTDSDGKRRKFSEVFGACPYHDHTTRSGTDFESADTF